MYNASFFARKGITSQTGIETFSDIEPDIRMVKMYGPGPYYKLMLRESAATESPQYFGWKDHTNKEYNHIYAWPGAVRMCFPYGIEAEEEKGNGKLIGFILENYVEVTDFD